MAIPSVNFISYNSTVIDSVKTNWIRDLCSTTNTDFFSIQEHFNATKSSYKFFEDQFPEYNPYVIPASRNEVQST